MNIKDIKKNLYDLEHSENLNYLNILLIIIATLFFMFIFNFSMFNKQIEIFTKVLSGFIVIVLVIVIIIIFNDRFSQTKNKIRQLFP